MYSYKIMQIKIGKYLKKMSKFGMIQIRNSTYRRKVLYIMGKQIFSISQITEKVSSLFKESFTDISVEGEVSGVSSSSPGVNVTVNAIDFLSAGIGAPS